MRLGLGKTLAIKGISLIFILFFVLFLTVIVIGATGISDRILSGIISDRLRAIRQELSTRIKNPEELIAAVAVSYTHLTLPTN